MMGICNNWVFRWKTELYRATLIQLHQQIQEELSLILVTAKRITFLILRAMLIIASTYLLTIYLKLVFYQMINLKEAVYVYRLQKLTESLKLISQPAMFSHTPTQ